MRVKRGRKVRDRSELHGAVSVVVMGGERGKIQSGMGTHKSYDL